MRAGQLRARAASDGRGPVVAEHNLASLSSPLALSDAPLAPWTGFATVNLIKALGVFPCIKINQTAQPVRDGFRPTSVFSRRNSRRHEYLQLVAKTLYTVDSFFHAPPASDFGRFIGGVMYSNQQQISSPEVVELRKEAGLWLKELREKRGLSQRQMAEKVGGIITPSSLNRNEARPDTPRPIFGVGRFRA